MRVTELEELFFPEQLRVFGLVQEKIRERPEELEKGEKG